MKVELNEPTMPKGMEFYVNGLGVLENGKAVDFSDEEVATFEHLTGQNIKDAFKGSSNVKVGASKGGDSSD